MANVRKNESNNRCCKTVCDLAGCLHLHNSFKYNFSLLIFNENLKLLSIYTCCHDMIM